MWLLRFSFLMVFMGCQGVFLGYSKGVKGYFWGIQGVLRGVSMGYRVFSRVIRGYLRGFRMLM